MTIENVKRYIEENELNVKNRKYEVVAKKQYLCAYLRHKYNMTYHDIKDMFNYGTHVTARHGVIRHETMIEINDTVYLLAISEVMDLFPFGESFLEKNMVFVYNIKLKLKEKRVLDDYGEGTDIVEVIDNIIKDKIESLKTTEI